MHIFCILLCLRFSISYEETLMHEIILIVKSRFNDIYEATSDVYTFAHPVEVCHVFCNS